MQLEGPPKTGPFSQTWINWLFNLYTFINSDAPTTTTADLEDVTNSVNTSSNKVAGYVIFNTTTNAPVWAAGSDDNSVWVDATGATTHTPI